MNDVLELSPQTAENLQQRLRNLATLMTRTAESLHQGEPVELQHVIEEITQVQDRVQQVSRKLQEHPLLSDAERYVTRSGEIIHACREINERQRALDQLKRLQLVKSFDPNDHEAFRHLVEQVTGMINLLTTGSQEERRGAVEAVVGMASPFRAVFELINRPEELSDDRWLENQRLISEAFGKNVALAILRGRAR